MLNSSIPSLTSTPFNPNKENENPNPLFTVCLSKRSNQCDNSMRTDPEFNMFKTINVQRQGVSISSGGVGTKSRVQMEAILENISTKNQSKRRSSQHSHKSFLALLGLAFGKEEFSVDEAIEKCEEFQITAKEQLLTLLDEKEPSREWPLPLSNLLLTDLGQLKVMKLCQSIENEEELSDHQLQILQFLLPPSLLEKVEVLDRNQILQSFNEFRTSIHERCSYADALVKSYTLRVQAKVKRVSDKVGLIKMEKKLKKYEKQNEGMISYLELKSSIGVLGLTQEEMLLAFKYFYFLENQKVLDLVDRKTTVKCLTCIKELLGKDERPLMVKHTISTLQTYEEENSAVINDLLLDKNYLLQTVHNQNTEIDKLKNQVALLQLELQSREKQSQEEKEREVASMKNRYQSQLEALEAENRGKDKLIRWYKNELEALVDQNKREFIASNRHKVFYRVAKSTQLRDNSEKSENNDSSQEQQGEESSLGEESDI